MNKIILALSILVLSTVSITDKEILQQTMNGAFEENKLPDPTTVVPCFDDKSAHLTVVFIGKLIDKLAKASISDIDAIKKLIEDFQKQLPQSVKDCLNGNQELKKLGLKYGIDDKTDPSAIEKKVVAYVTLHYLTVHKWLGDLDGQWKGGKYYPFGHDAADHAHTVLKLTSEDIRKMIKNNLNTQIQEFSEICHFITMSDSIRVVCRLRPLNKIQIANEGEECVTYSDKDIKINVGGDQNKYSFAFDKVFGPTSQQVSIYNEVATPIIKSVISGFNGTIFAYGQTGGGKTWTMEGPSHHDPEFKGLIPRTIQGLFCSITQCDENLQFLIKCSYVEIYNEKLFDLLDPSKARLQIKEDKQKGVFIQNCTQICVSSSDQMLKTMDSGSQNRKVAFTGMNQRSSRSHSIFIIHIFQKNLKKDSTKQSKLYFVDLAGSEKVGKTGVVGQQLQEAKNINKSLSSLGNVINALTSDKKQHIPYRDSKLTRILQESLGGNSKTTLIINCSMCTYNDRETLSTLRFGYRAKSIKNKPKVNEQKSVKELLILLEAANKTIAELKLQVKGDYVPSVNKEEEEQKMLQINDLKIQLQANKKEQYERNKELQLRIKQLIIELANEKEEKNRIEQKWTTIFHLLYKKLFTITKLSKRSYLDLQFTLNNIVMKSQETMPQTAKTIQSTLENLSAYEIFYEQQLKILLLEIIEQEKQQKELQEQFKGSLLSSEKKNSKVALSQPVLYPIEEYDHQINKSSQTLQMSMIVQKNITQENSYSDKVSQQSLSEIQTMLQSLQTKESHRHIVQEMSANMKSLKKQNQELTKQCEKHQEQLSASALKLQEQYEERLCDLEERAQQYKNIIHQKDIEFTKKFEEVEKMKKKMAEQKVEYDRLQKIIQTNGNMKSISELENKLRNLASERQKIFNQLYNIRGELDDAEMSLKQKDQHIDSLKNVLKELSQNPPPVYTPVEIEKTYNSQVYGTQNPHIIQTVKGGKQGKKSSLRKKTNSILKKEEEEPEKEKKNLIPFLKTLFK